VRTYPYSAYVTDEKKEAVAWYESEDCDIPEDVKFNMAHVIEMHKKWVEKELLMLCGEPAQPKQTRRRM
jgi:hypothetical protein